MALWPVARAETLITSAFLGLLFVAAATKSRAPPRNCVQERVLHDKACLRSATGQSLSKRLCDRQLWREDGVSLVQLRAIETKVFQGQKVEESDENHVSFTGGTITNSNRQGSNACVCTPDTYGNCDGQVCEYTCNEGFVAIGRHVYRRTYQHLGVTILVEGFYGGRCARLCDGDVQCSSTQVPVRWRANADNGEGCFRTKCVDAVSAPACGIGKCGVQESALMELVKGNWLMWVKARAKASGIYADHVNLHTGEISWGAGKADVTGMGLIMECVAHSLKLQTKSEAMEKVVTTLKTLAGDNADVKITRSPHGNFFPGVMDMVNGVTPVDALSGNVVATGILVGGVLFAKTYFERNYPFESMTEEIAHYANDLFESIEWDHMLCKDAQIDQLGTNVAWTVLPDGKCTNPSRIDDSGRMQFHEGFVARWLGYEWACHVHMTSSCENMRRVWKASNAFKSPGLPWGSPESQVGQTRLLSLGGAYIVQLPRFMAAPFMKDAAFMELFDNSWKAEKDFYTGFPYYASDRYGLGAGPTAKWCAGTNVSDRLDRDSQGCLTYTPSAVVGYMAGSDSVGNLAENDVLQFLAEGEAVDMIANPDTGYEHPILGRRMLVDPTWRPYAITMIDLSTELLGLAAYFLGPDFFKENTNHFPTP